MKKILAILLILSSIQVFSQRTNSNIGERSLSVGIGPSTLMVGDIGNVFSKSYINTNKVNTNFMVSVGYHVFHNNKFASNISIQSSAYEREENPYSFRSDVFQFTWRGEYHLLNSNYGFQPNQVYLTGGVGFLYGNYITRFKINEIATTRTPGTVISAVVPVGVGYRYSFLEKFKVGASLDLFYVPNDMIEGKGGIGSGYPHDILGSVMFNFSYTFSETKQSW